MTKSMKNLLWNITWLILRPLLVVFCRFRIKGAKNIKEFKKPCILAIATHSHILDSYIVGAAMPYNCHLYPIRYMTKDSFFKIPIIKYIIGAYGAFPVARGIGIEKSIKPATELTKCGETVGIFLEGKISKKGEIREGKPGAAALALATGLPVVPVALQGTHQIRNPLKFLFLQRKIIVSFGKPIFAQDFKLPSNPKSGNKKAIGKFTKIIMDKIKQLYFA